MGSARALAVAVMSLFPVLASAGSEAQGEWQEINDKDGIKVFRKQVEGSKIIAFRGVTVVELPLPPAE